MQVSTDESFAIVNVIITVETHR